MSAVLLGPVEAFPGAVPDKAQALKPLEEAAEAFGAWQSWRAWLDSGLDDPGGAPLNMRPYMARCEGRNRERGRL